MDKTCTILFNDGTALKLQYEGQLDPMTGAATLDEILRRNSFAIEVDGKLEVFPLANIRSITIDPSPDKLPANITRGATTVS